MNGFNLILLLILLITITSQQTHNHTIYHLTASYQDYQAKFQQKAGAKNTQQMTYFGTGRQLCANRQVCRFFTYLYQPQQVGNIKYNVLMTSGMHGNQLIGPTTLLYLYELLKPKDIRIIYFPVCNPSGYNLKQRYTYPNGLDVNRDFPIDGNSKCYEGTSTRIIDKIFRKYKIDLTINLHNGADEIGWNWGTNYHAKRPQTQNQPMYSSIGQMLKLIGGYNRRLNIQPFQIGTMDDVIYPAQGTLDDWAYAASWIQSTVPYRCNNYAYEPYPKDMHQGLVFIFQLGEHNTPQNKLGTSQGLTLPSDSTSISNGYIPRAIRMLTSLIKIMSPVVLAEIKQSQLFIKIEGCKKIDLMSLEVSSQQTSNVKDVFTNKQELDTVQNSFTFVGKFQINNKQLLSNANLTLNYHIQCDRGWNGIGKTFLGRPRVFKDEISLSNTISSEQIMAINGRVIKFNGKILAIFFGLLALILIIYSIYDRRRKDKIFQKIRKYEASDSDISNIHSTHKIQQRNSAQNMEKVEIEDIQLTKV